MASVNKVILVGNLGRDPEMRAFPNGDQIANVTLATTDRWRDKQSGEMREHTEWHRLVFNGRLAEIVQQYLRKGSQIYVEGSIRTRKWQDQATGQDRYSTEIRVDQMQMLGRREGDGSYGSSANNAYGGSSNSYGGGGAAGGSGYGSNNSHTGYGNSGGGGGSYAQRSSAPTRPPAPPTAPRPQPAPQMAPGADGFDDMDDDIPF